MQSKAVEQVILIYSVERELHHKQVNSNVHLAVRTLFYLHLSQARTLTEKIVINQTALPQEGILPDFR